MKLIVAYLLASAAFAERNLEDASLRGGGGDVISATERKLANACANSDTDFDTYSGEDCYSRCACQACRERGGGVCCAASCNPQASSCVEAGCDESAKVGTNIACYTQKKPSGFIHCSIDVLTALSLKIKPH